MHRYVTYLVFIAMGLLLHATPVLAAYPPSFTPITPIYSLKPYDQVFWYNPARSGAGWTFGSIPSPTRGGTPVLSGAFYTYDESGRPSWLITQGVFEEATAEEFARDQILGRFRSPLYESPNGPCFGCPYVANGLVVSPYGHGEIVYTSRLAAEVYAEGVLMDTIEPIDLTASQTREQLFAGAWSGDGRGAAATFSATVTITPVPNPSSANRYEADSVDPPHRMPAANAAWYKVDGIPISSMLYLALDRVTGEAHIFNLLDELAIAEPSPVGPPRIVGWRLRGLVSFADPVLLGPDDMVIRVRLNSADTLEPYQEYRLRRDP